MFSKFRSSKHLPMKVFWAVLWKPQLTLSLWNCCCPWTGVAGAPGGWAWLWDTTCCPWGWTDAVWWWPLCTAGVWLWLPELWGIAETCSKNKDATYSPSHLLTHHMHCSKISSLKESPIGSSFATGGHYNRQAIQYKYWHLCNHTLLNNATFSACNNKKRQSLLKKSLLLKILLGRSLCYCKPKILSPLTPFTPTDNWFWT